MPRKKADALAEPTPSPSVLFHCELHGQTKEIVLARWDQVKTWDDVTPCWCCTGPCKYAGVGSMDAHEVQAINPKCSRCAPKEVTE